MCVCQVETIKTYLLTYLLHRRQEQLEGKRVHITGNPAFESYLKYHRRWQLLKSCLRQNCFASLLAYKRMFCFSSHSPTVWPNVAVTFWIYNNYNYNYNLLKKYDIKIFDKWPNLNWPGWLWPRDLTQKFSFELCPNLNWTNLEDFAPVVVLCGTLYIDKLYVMVNVWT